MFDFLSLSYFHNQIPIYIYIPDTNSSVKEYKSVYDQEERRNREDYLSLTIGLFRRTYRTMQKVKGALNRVRY
jgi:hypothetical protein